MKIKKKEFLSLK
jgi:hypothetical protein